MIPLEHVIAYMDFMTMAKLIAKNVTKVVNSARIKQITA